MYKRQGDTLYVALDYIKQYTNFSYQLFTDPYRIQLTTEWPSYEVASISKNTQVRVCLLYTSVQSLLQMRLHYLHRSGKCQNRRYRKYVDRQRKECLLRMKRLERRKADFF